MNFKKLFCKHDYEVIDAWKDDWRIYQRWRCVKCDKVKTVVR